jgi:hypothetical protein
MSPSEFWLKFTGVQLLFIIEIKLSNFKYPLKFEIKLSNFKYPLKSEV